MSTLTLDTDPLAVDVSVDNMALRVVLADGRELSVPVEWFPRLGDGSQTARDNWRLIGVGEGIHWPDLDEDISVMNLIAGRIRRPRAA